MSEKVYRAKYRVYYEDTDAEGIVYYGNYLHFIERGRTEMLREQDITHQELVEQYNMCLVVKRCEIEYYAPARLDDIIAIETKIIKFGRSSLVINQKVYHNEDNKLLAEAQLVIVCVAIDSFKPVSIPDSLRKKLN